MSIWLIVLIVLFSLLLTISLVIYFIQDSMLFHAEKLPLDYKFSFQNDFEEINLKTEDGESLNGLKFAAKDPKGVILFFHNHSGNLNHWNRSALFINKFNYDVLMMDYRGFGKSTGKYNEKLMLSDSLLWYNLIKKMYKEESIIVYGRGLGSAFATYVASKNNPNKLVLESPIFSINYTSKTHYPYLPTKLILKYKFETSRYIKNVKCKTFIFHGLKDRLVHYSSSEKLHELTQEISELFLISEGNHYNLINNKVFLNKIKEIMIS